MHRITNDLNMHMNLAMVQKNELEISLLLVDFLSDKSLACWEYMWYVKICIILF